MHDKYFNRIRLFWAAEAHKKFVNKKNKKEEQLLEIEKKIFKVVVQIFISVISLVAILSAIMYTAIWLS